MNQKIYDSLIQHSDEKYKEFQSKLVPNIPKETIIGVKTPNIRKIAKELYGTTEMYEFINELPHKYYEENLIHFFLISMIRDFDECIKAVETFLPYVDCWPVCDQSSPKVFTKNHEKLIVYVKKWISSNHVYTSRFGIRMLMNEFLGSDFKNEYLEWVSSVKGEDYYIKMMVAWFFATALAKRYDESMIYIENHKLEPWVHKKTIQKAIESYRISNEHKEYLKSLRGYII